jgi:hypothetical protein
MNVFSFAKLTDVFVLQRYFARTAGGTPEAPTNVMISQARAFYRFIASRIWSRVN